ncbi:MAG TPA: endolytic transglycosylase MltG [Methylocella sp.]|nr:endolytic transglycosylase MltG [Methylocella sp.]
MGETPQTPNMPEKPNGNDAQGADQALRGGSYKDRRFSAQRVTPRSPSEALQPDAAPPPPIPPRRRRPTLSAFSGFLSFLLVAALATMFGLVWSQQRLRAPGPLTATKILYIAPGTEVADIIGQLDHEGVIDSPFLLNTALLLEGNRSKVKAGEYLFKQNASLRDVIDTLVSGKQVLHAITIPEGLTSEQIVERLRESDILLGDVVELPKEGSLLPETYKVVRGAVRADLIKKMQDDQKRAVDQIWSHRASGLPLRSPYELITLASIVEKETGKADERPRVASVFLNRLRKGMRLQSDPTTVYGLAGGKGSLGRGLSRSELDKPTPYNTYVIDGLPPGPIANPGRAALEAVANPSRTQDLYFVADGTGGHVFSETLDQHNRNVQRWRQIEKDMKDKQEQPAPDAEKTVEPAEAPAVPPPAPNAPATMPGGTPPPGPSAPSPGGDRKSERGVPASIYGSLPASLDPAKSALPTPPPSLSYAQATSAIAGVLRAADTKPAKVKPAADISAFTLGPGLDELGISVGGVSSPSAATLDGPIGQEDAADAPSDGSSPAPDGAERTMRAMPVGFQPGAGDSSNPPAGSGTPAPPPQNDRQAAHPKAFDASQGTPLDPLRNKTWDLNYAKTVPPMP